MLKLKTYKQNTNEFVSEKPKREKNTKYTKNNFENVDMKNDFKKKVMFNVCQKRKHSLS